MEGLQRVQHSGALGEGGQAAALLAQICCSEEEGGAIPLNFHKGAHTVFFTLCVRRLNSQIMPQIKVRLTLNTSSGVDFVLFFFFNP